jgi:hypothetical protein
MDDELAKVLAGTVDEVKGKLDELSPEQLRKLLAAEKAGAKRTTLIEPIEHAIKEAESGEKGAAGASDDGAAPTDPAAGAEQPVFTQAQFDAALAERETAWAAERDRLVAEAEGKNPPRPRKTKPAVALTIEKGNGDFVARTMKSGAQVQFVDDQDVPLPGLPPMTFGADAFERSGDAVRLARKVTFPNALPANEVSGAFLSTGNGAAAKARLIGAQPIGGGRDVELPAGTLMFAPE